MNEDIGAKFVRPLLGGLLGGSRPRRLAGSLDSDSAIGGRGQRIPNDAQLAALIEDGALVLPPRYFMGYFLDLLI